jgi:hypothetical protein
MADAAHSGEITWGGVISCCESSSSGVVSDVSSGRGGAKAETGAVPKSISNGEVGPRDS